MPVCLLCHLISVFSSGGSEISSSCSSTVVSSLGLTSSSDFSKSPLKNLDLSSILTSSMELHNQGSKLKIVMFLVILLSQTLTHRAVFMALANLDIQLMINVQLVHKMVM